jgi:hypothetical protein
MTIIVSTVGATVLVLLIFLLIGSLAEEKPSAKAPEDDLAAPYREGLHAAVRLQRSAQDLEQQIWAEAARHADAESSGRSAGGQ